MLSVQTGSEWEFIASVHDEIILRKRKEPLAKGNEAP